MSKVTETPVIEVSPNEDWLQTILNSRQTKFVLVLLEVDEELDLDDIDYQPEIPIRKLISFKQIKQEDVESFSFTKLKQQ